MYCAAQPAYDHAICEGCVEGSRGKEERNEGGKQRRGGKGKKLNDYIKK